MAKDETHVDLSEEQWATVKAALDGEIADLQRQLQQAQEKRNKLKEPVPDDPNPCPRCGRQYGLCASVSSEDWFRITGHWNGGGHLCLWCMDALAVEKGLSGIHCTLSFAGRAIWSDDDPVEEVCQARARGKLLWKQVVEEQTILRITTGYLLAAERDAKAKGALAEARLRMGLWALSALRLAIQKGIRLITISRVGGIDALYMTRNQTERATPAEAAREGDE